MNKKTVWLLVAVGVAIVGYVAYRWYQANVSSNSPTGGLGTNLNSVAPELVGGSAGPSVGPAFNMPVNVTYTQTTQKSQIPDAAMLGVNAATGNALTDTSADVPGSMDSGMSDETAADNSSSNGGGDGSSGGGGNTDISVPASDVTVNSGNSVNKTDHRTRHRDRDRRKR